MYRLPSGGAKKHFVAAVALALLALVGLWLDIRGSPPQSAQDFEDCVEQVHAKAPANAERGALMKACDARFAGRRKAGSGYTYYDFMQDRNFDIAGPNPTAEERKQIDRAYMDFLDTQRREAVSVQERHLNMRHTPHDPCIVVWYFRLHDRTRHPRIEDRARGRVEVGETHRTRVTPNGLIRVDEIAGLPTAGWIGFRVDHALIPLLLVAGESRCVLEERPKHDRVVCIDPEARGLGSRQRSRIASTPG